MSESLVALVLEVEGIKLESTLTREVWSYVSLSSSFSVFVSLPDVCVPFPRLLKEGSHLLLLLLPQFWLCHSSFICMQQDVLPSAAFFIYLLLWQLFLGWMLPVCSCMYTCFPCWWPRCSDTYVKCSCIVCVYAITMAQSAYKLLLVRLFSMLILYLVQGKLILLYPKQCTLSFFVSRISALATTSLIFL